MIRVATEQDLKVDEKNREKEKKAFEICQEKIKKHKLDMSLIDVEYTLSLIHIFGFYRGADFDVGHPRAVWQRNPVWRTGDAVRL